MLAHPARRAAAGQQYALIVGLVGVVALLSINFLGSGVNTLMSRTSNTLGGVVNGATAGGPGAPPPPPPPTGPSAFTFTDLTAQAQNTLISSNIVQITGISAGSFAVTVSGGGSPQFRICADSVCTSELFTWGSVSQNIANNQYLQLRLTSSSSDNTSLSATATINGVSDNWSVATDNALYAFTSHTFTNCGQTGRNGPSLTTCRGQYSPGNSWDENNSYFSMVTTGIQVWTVPVTGSYQIVASGAGGGNNSTYNGGRGAVVTGTFTLTKSAQIQIMVGQRGADNTSDNCDAGSGGGTFVATASNTPLIIAGGGSGASNSGNGNNGSTTTTSGSADGAGNSSGNGGAASSSGSDGGGGFYSSGTANNSSYGDTAGRGFSDGGIGGNTASDPNSIGGFGGGGGGHGDCYIGSGGAGGYSGGGAGGYNVNLRGGGGGSFNSGTTPTATVNGSNTHGSVQITKL